MLRLVLDTNVWLDWLVFDDPGIKPLREAHAAGRALIFTDPACGAELAEVLARDFGKHSLDPAARVERLTQFIDIALVVGDAELQDLARLPKCRDPDDQKFLAAALAARADALVTKDRALLDLSGAPFRIITPSDLEI